MCTICDLRIEFSVDHPSSLSVAVDTRRAVDAGLLPEPDDAPTGMAARAAATKTLRAVQQRLEWTQRMKEFLTLPDFFVLLVESRTWAFFHPTTAGFALGCRPGPPILGADDEGTRDVVVVSTELAMHQMAGGRLPFGQALSKGLIVLDADPGRHDKLLPAWSKAYPENGFSRFVCL